MPLHAAKTSRPRSTAEEVETVFLEAGGPEGVRALWSALAERVEILSPGRAFDAMDTALEPLLEGDSGREAFLWLWNRTLEELESDPGGRSLLLDGSLALLCGCRAFAGAGSRLCGPWLSPERARAQHPLRGGAAPDPEVWANCLSLAQRLSEDGATDGRPGSVAHALLAILSHPENREMGWEARRALKAFLGALAAGACGRDRAWRFGAFLGAPSLAEVAPPDGALRVLPFQPKRFLRIAPNLPGLAEGWRPGVGMWVQAALRHVLRGAEPLDPYRPGIYSEAWAKLRLDTLAYALCCAGAGVVLDDWIESPCEMDRGPRTAARFLLWPVPGSYARQAKQAGKSPFGHLLGLEDPWGDYGRWRTIGGSLRPLEDGSLHRGLAHHAWQALGEGPR